MKPASLLLPSYREPAIFDPIEDDASVRSTGQRRQIARVNEVLLWRWPLDRKAQFQAFDDWHDIAMQIAHRAGIGFRLLAVYRKVIRWNEGCVWKSDKELALEAGRCNWKTISREVADHRALGIIHVDHGWRLVDGNRLRTRVIRPAVPAVFDPEIVVRDLASKTVNSGPHEMPVHTVNSGPSHTVNSGPITIDTNEEGASSNVSA